MKFETNRLHIRPVQAADSHSLFTYRSKPETNRFQGLVPQSVDDLADFIAKTVDKINLPGTWFQLVLIEKASGSLIGDIGIHFLETDAENRQVEIGYTLHQNYRGQGYASEALSRIIDFLVNDLDKHRIIASIDPANTDSIRLMERLGFRKEAHFVKSLFFHGQWVDDLIYATLASEWKSRRQGKAIN